MLQHACAIWREQLAVRTRVTRTRASATVNQTSCQATAFNAERASISFLQMTTPTRCANQRAIYRVS